jgi:hypothetical protein
MVTHAMKIRITFFLLLISVLLTAVPASAQRKIMIHGYVLDSVRYSPVNNATVLNTNTNHSVKTNSKGTFTISVGLNDVLYITADNYHFDTVRYKMMMRDTIYIYLALLPHELPGVTVTTKGYTQYQLDSIKRNDDFRAAMGNPPKAVADNANSGAGVGVSLDYFSKKEKDKRKAYKTYTAHEEEMYVRSRFSPEIVQSYTGLTGEPLQHFMQLYTPSYEWLRAHTSDEDILYYLNDKLKLFYKRRDE